MNIAVNELARSIFKKPLEECTPDELKQLANQYPYFGPAQLLLAKKLFPGAGAHEKKSSLYEEQVQKASLYFQNRLWLHYLLNDDYDNIPIMEHPSMEIEREQNKPEPLPEPVVNENIEKEIEAIPDSPKEEITEQPGKPVEIPALKIEPLPADAGLTFEPYHTVDYFASQGIRFKEEDKPQDRFGQQLKSFTEWLKTMKRIPVSEIATPADTGSEKKVEEMAEYSLVERHVITEAMAEVWIKQGNKIKAEEIYHKLSLLDPSKSSYFAAKIEDLKKTS
jgi:hypothetical protein